MNGEGDEGGSRETPVLPGRGSSLANALCPLNPLTQEGRAVLFAKVTTAIVTLSTERTPHPGHPEPPLHLPATWPSQPSRNRNHPEHQLGLLEGLCLQVKFPAVCAGKDPEAHRWARFARLWAAGTHRTKSAGEARSQQRNQSCLISDLVVLAARRI